MTICAKLVVFFSPESPKMCRFCLFSDKKGSLIPGIFKLRALQTSGSTKRGCVGLTLAPFIPRIHTSLLLTQPITIL